MTPELSVVRGTASWLAVVVDGHRKIVFAVRHLAPEGDVLNLDVAEFLDGFRYATEQCRYVTLTRPLRVRLREVEDHPLVFHEPEYAPE